MHEVRPVRDGDVPAISVIYAEAVLHGTASFELDPPDAHEMARRIRALVEDEFPFVVAELEGEAIGYAYAGPYRTRPAYRFTVENSVYVRERMRGRQVGRALLADVIALRGLGFRQMVAVIGDSANLSSIRLHETLGFKPAGVLSSVGWKHGRWIDSVLMQRQLGEGAASPPE